MNIGSCLSLNLSYPGCCVYHLSLPCSNNGCYCDKYCHQLGDCCSDVADIDCHPSNSPGKTKSKFKKYISQNYFQANKSQSKQ